MYCGDHCCRNCNHEAWPIPRANQPCFLMWPIWAVRFYFVFPCSQIFLFPVIYCFSGYSMSYTCCCYTIFFRISNYSLTKLGFWCYTCHRKFTSYGTLFLSLLTSYHIWDEFSFYFVTYLLYHNIQRFFSKTLFLNVIIAALQIDRPFSVCYANL